VKFAIDRFKIYLVVPSKRGGGSEAEVRGDGSTSSTELHGEES